jgi:glucose/arabinose dehydrogenase
MGFTGSDFMRVTERSSRWCVLFAAAGLFACSTSHVLEELDAGANTGGGTNASGGGSAVGGDGSSGGSSVAGASGAPSASGTAFCAGGQAVAGAVPASGFCVRQFASIVEARTLAVAPNGDLFIGAPTQATPGGANNGPGQILVASDDNQDGVAELSVFADHLPDVHGLAIGGGYLYFTGTTSVFRTPYVSGQRKETGPREDMMMPTSFSGRWTHGLAISQGGTLIASNGEYSSCGVASPIGYVARVTMGGAQVLAGGFRNPMYVRCHYQDELCAANELGEDQTTGAREKFVVINPETNFGFPCCFGANQPVVAGNQAACMSVTAENDSYELGNTPFGFDWERGLWPAPYKGGIFVALHGSAYSSPQWAGARIVFTATDPTTHLPVENKWTEFLGGFGPGGTLPFNRPADIAFSPDGRMFFADDTNGHVYWVAPTSLVRP